MKCLIYNCHEASSLTKCCNKSKTKQKCTWLSWVFTSLPHHGIQLVLVRHDNVLLYSLALSRISLDRVTFFYIEYFPYLLNVLFHQISMFQYSLTSDVSYYYLLLNILPSKSPILYNSLVNHCLHLQQIIFH